jgi:hypothetical protein
MRPSRLREYVRVLARDFGPDLPPPGLSHDMHLIVANDLRTLIDDRPVVAMEDFFFPPMVLAERAGWPVVYVRKGTWYERVGNELVVPEARTYRETSMNLLEAIAARSFRDHLRFARRSDHLLLAIELAVPRFVAERFPPKQILQWQPHLPRWLVVLCCNRVRTDVPRPAGSGGDNGALN